LKDHLEGDLRGAESAVEGLMIAIGESQNEGLRGVVQAFTNLIRGIYVKAETPLERAKKKVDELGESLVGLGEAERRAKITERIDDLTEMIQRSAQETDDWRDKLIKAAGNIWISTKKVAELKYAFDGCNKTTKIFREELFLLENGFWDLVKVEKEVVESTDKVISAFDKAAEAARKVDEAIIGKRLKPKGKVPGKPELPETLGIIPDPEAFAPFAEILEKNIELSNQFIEALSGIEAGALAIADAMTFAAVEGGASLKDLAKVAVEAARKVIAAQIAEGVAGAVKKALITVPFPFNIAAAMAAGAVAASLFNMIIPKFEHGGIVPSGYPSDTYPAMLTSGETITPPNKLPENNRLGRSQKVEFIIEKDQLVGVLEMYNNQKNNF